MKDDLSNDLAGAAHYAAAGERHDPSEYNPADDYPTVIECPQCGGPGTYLGTLGQLHWLRCRDCGMDFERHEAEVAADQDDDARCDDIDPAELESYWGRFG